MHDWIYQGGHPIITATATPHGLRVEQRAFTLDPNVADDRTWSVPLVIRHDGETTSALLTEGSMLLTGITGTPTTVNAGAAGFFRTAIDEAILTELEANGPGDRTPTERHGLVDDAWSLTVAGSLSAVDFLRLARALAGEDDLNVWQALATGLHGLDRLVEGTAADVLAGIIRKLAGPTLASIGFEPGADDDRTLELRATLVRLLGTAGNDAEVIAAAQGRSTTLMRHSALPHSPLSPITVARPSTTRSAPPGSMRPIPSPKSATNERSPASARWNSSSNFSATSPTAPCAPRTPRT